jgi:PAS domain S-box-containing protein
MTKVQSLLQQYRSALSDYLAGAGETALTRAYELGRQAVATEQPSVLEIVATHQEALASALLRGNTAEEGAQLARKAGEFLEEYLTPVEMARRGFQEAIVRLRGLNEALEKQTEELTLSEARSSSMALFPAENPGPVVRVNRDGLVIYANATAEALLAMMGRRSCEPLPEPYRSQVLEALATNQRRDIEATFQDQTFLITLAPNPEAGYVNLYGRDITLRKRAEAAAQRERQRFRDALDQLPAYLVLLKPDYHVSFANRFFEDRFGKSEGRRCYEYLFQRTEPCENCETCKVLRTNAPHHWEWTGPDGRDYDIHDFPFTDVDGSPLIMEVGLDITERKLAEKALQGSEERYRALIEQSPTLVIIVQDEHVRYANPAAVRAIGYTLEELGAKSPLDFVHPQGRAQAREALRRVARGETLENVEIPILTKAGEMRWVQCSGTRIDLGGKPAVMVNGVDVTQQKQLEQQLIQSAKLTAIGELISGVAHELNNPLAGVLGCAQLAQELEVEGEVAEYLEKIVEQSRRAAGIVTNLLVFARQKEPEREPVSLNAVATRALDLRRYELRVSNIQVVTELDDGLPYIQGDSQQLVQVLLNLINNAEHAIQQHRGSGTVTIRTSAFSRDGAPWARLEVLDDGPGIPEPILGRIFEPFFTTKDPGEGTGLGLSVSYGIVTTHQGFISAQNRPEGGARFVVELPVAEAQEQATPAAGSRTPAAAPARILIIEDEQPVATVLTRLLSGDGHRVSVAGEGTEALARLQAEPFDLVITDFKMPGMSGLEFYRALAAAHPRLARGVIFTTGDVFSAETRRFFAEVGAPVLYKPFTLEQARATIYDKLQEAQDERGNRAYLGG